MLSRFRSTLVLALGAWLGLEIWAGAPVLAQIPGRDAFSREPRTPLETWEVADYLIQIGQPAQAVPYLKKFVDAKPDDATLLAIRDAAGPGPFLRLSADPATRPFARPLAERLAEASVRKSTDPARIARLLPSLSATRAEQTYAIGQLREAGPYAVPALIQYLTSSGLEPANRSAVAENLGELDRKAVPALIAALESPSAAVVGDVARALGRIGDPRAVPPLTYLAARKNPPTPARAEVEEAIQALTGRSFASQPVTAVRLLTDEAWRYHRHAYQFPGDPIVVWVWDASAGVPVAKSFPVREAEGYLGLRAAREALAVDPKDLDAQVALVSLALDHDPTGARPSALAAGPEVLGRVLRTAIADGRGDLAATAASLLGLVVDRNELNTEGRPNPLIEALSSPDRRVQLAAADALIRLDPRKRFPGSSRVVPILARFAANGSTPRALVVDGNPERAGQVAGFLRGIGYDSQIALTGAQGFKLATETADIELILVDPSFVNDAWKLPDLLANLRLDGRTAGIPVVIVGPLDLRDRLASRLESFPGIQFVVTPTETALFKEQLDRALKDLGARPLSDAERVDFARRASTLLAVAARRPGSPFEADLPQAEPALATALGGQNAPGEAAVVLGDTPGVAAQRALADTALDGGRPIPLRVVAAQQLARNVRRFGPALSDDQERRLVTELADETDPALRDALAVAAGALKPGPDASGSRIQTYRSPGTTP
jgi:HEAT repeat protein